MSLVLPITEGATTTGFSNQTVIEHGGSALGSFRYTKHGIAGKAACMH